MDEADRAGERAPNSATTGVASGRQIAKVISRAVSLEIRNTPEGKMWLAAIELALSEADKKKGSEEPRRWLSSEGFCLILDLLGLEPDYVLELIRDHAGWMRRRQHG